ncbi:unnamed protein product, partial [Citrullus colocynthis]
GWGLFTSQLEEAVVLVVREFSANISENGSTSIARGRMVRFDALTINHLFDLLDIYKEYYVSSLDRGLNLPSVRQ